MARLLFAVPSGKGDISYAFDLAAHLDADVQVYVLPWPEQMPASMEALAARMAELMRAVQPTGPYRLVGLSSGGLLAYAVAQHLGELDEPVEFVGLLDCDNPSVPPTQATRDELTKESLLGQLALTDNYSHQEDLQQAVRELQADAPTASLPELVALCDASPALRALAAQEQTSIGQFAASCGCAAAYNTLWPTYLAQPLPASSKLHLFHATEACDPPGPLGWDRLLPRAQIDIVPVPGTHSSMVEPPHIAELGRAVSQALRTSPSLSSDRHAPALVLQTGRTGNVPIICVPGAGDSITSFVKLGVALGSEQTLVGMQPRGVDGTRLPYGSVELAATHYLEAMRAHVRPGAPVHLLGHSFGGWVVFEMARQLRAAGASLASLTLIDVQAPDDTPGICDCSRDAVIDRFLEALSMHVEQPLPIEPASLRELTAEALIEALHRLMVDLKLMPVRSKPDALRGPLFSFARACRTRYCPGTRYDGPVRLVLVPDTRLSTEADQQQRQHVQAQWRHHAPALDVWHGPGNHMTVLDAPHVRALAGWWRTAVLEGAQVPQPGGEIQIC